MEEEVRKRGILYLQQQKFGKKWKKVWSLVYGDSGCSVSRLELLEWRDGAESSERKRSKRDSRKVIRMSDLVRVAEDKMAACPRGCGAFRVETAEKSFLFAAESSELGDWRRTLCEIAFPMNQGQCEDSMTQGTPDSGMMENSIYCTSSALKDFPITVKVTEASARCQLKGSFILRVDLRAIHLLHPKTGATRYTWPFNYIRKFGLQQSTFSIEAGRMSKSGEGVFEFQTKQNEKIFQAVDAAINLQSSKDRSQTWDPSPGPVVLDDDDSLYSKVTKVRRPRPQANALLAGVEEMPLDDVSVGDWGWGMSHRPLPTPGFPREPPPGRQTPPDSPQLSENEPDYEEVDVGAMATQEPPPTYDSIFRVGGPALEECPYDMAGANANHGHKLKRMLTNPCFDCDEVDSDPMTTM
ncbi:docking protein 2-like [Conger conger]|uniref:docking protein 2-like n=1 Tax=Conger conger TaxID=82655 RepID=UPI002A5A39BF|nr:docking protein 2-like [Conger conger]